MVSAVSSVNTVNTTTKSQKIQSLIKYTKGEALDYIPDTFAGTAKSSAQQAALWEGIPLVNTLIRNKKLHGKAISAQMAEIGSKNVEALQHLLKGEGSFLSRVSDFASAARETNKAFIDLKHITKLEHQAEKLTQKAAKATGKKADKLAQKAANALDKAAKSKVAQEAVETGVKSAGKLGKFGKFLKASNAGAMAIFSGIAECLTEVVPTFKELGKEKGMKQLGKSTVKVLGDTAGFVLGEQAGIALGTAIGTAICPGIGSAVGAVIGFAGGLLGSFVAGKITRAITGKSEREKAQEEQEKLQAENAANDDEALKELTNEVIAKIQEDAMDGELTKDSEKALALLENLDESNPFAAA